MNYMKAAFRLVFPFFTMVVIGCTTVKYYPNNFVESLKHPTKFPSDFSSTVQNIEEVANKNPLGDNEDVKITDVGENKNSSMHLVQVRENSELHLHYHKRHDEVIYVKKGSGIATLDGTRYMIKPGSILQIPSKTVHNFLNTGGERFVAVSIFSPPFDGRDEKMIKEKRKADRGAKQEKKLATKKQEKVAKEDVTSAVKEPRTTPVKSEKVVEKDLNETTPSESDIDTDTNTAIDTDSDTEKSTPPSQKHVHSEGKKKSKEVMSHEEPAISITDLHEKLAKLLELKEEGTISESEYEEKKDALMRGEDVGELPAVKGYAKKKTQEEVDDEPILKMSERHSPVEKSVSDQDQEAITNVPELSQESESATSDVVSEEKESQPEDKQKLLEDMLHEGLITEEDYKRKRSKLSGVKEVQEEVKPSGSIAGDDRIKELEDMYHEGLITEEDYEIKKKELIGAVEKKGGTTSSENTDHDERVEELEGLYKEGLITEDDYKYKLKELTGAQTQNPLPDISHEKRNDIGELSEPELAGGGKTQERDEESVPKLAEKNVPVNEGVSREGQASESNNPDLLKETETTTHDMESEGQGTPSEDSLKMSDLSRQDILKTDVGHENGKEEPSSPSEEKINSTSSENAIEGAEDKELKTLQNLLYKLKGE